jgi:glutathione S-transferase
MYKLYYFPGNANLAPHMVLEEIGAPYELVLVDRNQNAHGSPEYLKLNPAGRIPVLIDADLVLPESAAICLHLADRHPEANLAPPLGTPERATFYRWLMYLTNTLQAELIAFFYPERMCDDEQAAAQVKRHADARIGGMLDILDAQLAQSRGPFLLGERYTVADPFLMMLSRWTRMTSRPARTLPHLGAFLATMAARPAVRRAFTMEGLQEPWY